MSAEGVSSQFHLAVLGADDPLGESFLKALEESQVSVGRLYPLALGETEGIVAFRGEEWPCLAVEEFDFGQVQALVIASPHASAERIADGVRQSRPAMPMLSLHAITPAPAVAAARVLAVLAALGEIVQAEAFVNLSAALAGKAGLEELINQSRGLFNMESPDPEAFPLQIAFNLIPLLDQAGERLAPRYAPSQLTAATLSRLPLEEMGYSVAWTPLLYGASMALHARLAGAVTGEDLRRALKRQEGICLMESDLPAGNPTPATDSLESADIFLGQVRATGNNVRFWLVFDPLRLEAEQMVAVVENWIEKPANSVLT